MRIEELHPQPNSGLGLSMPIVRPSYAKAIIRRAFHLLVDPDLTEAEKADRWNHFDNRCAFCDIIMDRATRKAHMDHLISVSSGGSNHSSNRVLSCSVCNGDEKLDQDWIEFLRAKSGSEEVFNMRREKILSWKVHAGAAPAVPARLRVMAEAAAEEVIALFEERLREMREAKRGITHLDRATLVNRRRIHESK